MNYTFFFSRLLVGSLLLSFSASFAFGANRLSADEIQALRDIGETLGKSWNFSVDPCSGEQGWISAPVGQYMNNVTCGNCSTTSNSTTDQICHVTHILLKAQNLTGQLPPELINLPYLQEIDLTRNYLNGTIPPKWGSLPLVTISLVGNRLTGSIPAELGNITTLESLAIDFNSFSGVLPEELGNLTRIQRMLLTSNNFTGELPETFAKLTDLTDFRISDSSFSGKIPDFIQGWTNLEGLVIQASGFTGPIPSGISLLTSIIDLRITDLNGSESSFPVLNNMTSLETLVLRNCNISGHLPEFLGNMSTLKKLDLSFNELSGDIPNNFAGLGNLDNLFLTGNMLTGTVPADWMKAKSIDLSYNNFTMNSNDENCEPQDGLNLFASSFAGNTSSVSCLPLAKCVKTWYTLHINCGGKEVPLYENFTRPTNATYEEDTDVAGPSSVYLSRTNWASSTTGYFANDDRPTNTYTWTNSSELTMANPELYMNARLSPISLTYYGFCLGNGNYTVNLHFAEIIFANDTTYSGLGRRVFDIYIQGSLALKDFNIADAAGGFGKAVTKKFTANVTDSTLEIRLFWAGKGTTGVPYRGDYGPLISAISIDSDSPPPETSSGGGSSGISAGAVVGIVAGGVFIILLVLGILWWKGFIGPANTLEQDLKGVDLQTSRFSLRQIKTATNNFDIMNKIGEGGFGPVYKGLLSDDTAIAVKKLSAKSKQGNREFVNEIGMISALQHPHLVKLYGCCIEGNDLLLVYEYLENNSVARALFGPKASQVKMDWRTRHRICVGIAKGLAYLHEESRLKIVHRDIKATNVLLDKNLCPKIADFGLAKLDEEDNTHISTRIAGTFGYMAPEYAMRGYLTDKADVYSYGIVVLEIVSGRGNTTYHSKEECFYLLDWALLLKEKGSLLDLVDPRLGSEFNKEEMITTINVALLCSHVSSAVRPSMSSVVKMLEGRASVQEVISDPNASNNEMIAMRKHFQSSLEEQNGDVESQRQTMSIEPSWTSSSTSAQDLYSVHPDSSYWEKRN
uniref:probable leucine-rich repeat receptor-like serine/threonine-protein kinase At3g14840 isoform X1 n=2 Tax=Fragaria vesca subsp. vesca TaxID=101020 RepID=UPI0005CB2C94|nr:PREDICTED: probable leucine-rich repeat receptor-like serine/threonine-protein kinase At3g14840 isoform X1 [Fragaria vesca subsp. vesca]